MNFAQVAARAYNVPVLMEPSYGHTFYNVLNQRVFSGSQDIVIVNHTGTEPQASSSAYTEIPSDRQPYQIVSGVGIIRVEGTLVHRNGNALSPSSGLTGYDGIERLIKAMAKNDTVEKIVFDINSSGGEATGCFELCEMIADLEKPTLAIVNMKAYSGAYAIAAACDYIAVPERGGVGSVGVFNVHADFSKQIEGAGVKISMFYEGARKVDGHPMLPLNDKAAQKIQAGVKQCYEDFTSFVAVNRGLTQEAVKNTEADTFYGAAAVKIGLADVVMSKDDAFKAFIEGRDFDANPSVTTSENGDQNMTGKTPKASAPETDIDMVSKADHDAAVNAAKADGYEKGVEAERQRWKDIIRSDEAENRMDTAISFAENGLAVDAAKSALKTVPAQTPQATAIQQMENNGGAGVDAGEDITEDADGNSDDVVMAV